MRKLFLTAVAALVFISSTAQTVHFASNSAVIADSVQRSILQTLDQVCYRLEYIGITGYADSIGSIDSNLALSARRAEAVRELFLKNGIKKDSLFVRAAGAVDFIASNDTEAGRAKNRRVQIEYKLRWMGDYVDGLDDIELLYQRLKDKGTTFCIDPTKDTVLVAEQGSILIIPANTFRTTGNCTCLELVFHEYFSKGDMALNNLTTTSNDIPLASGGMTKLEAYCDHSGVTFNPQLTITIMVPTATPDEAMSMFTGDRQQRKELINWADAKFKTLSIIYKDGLRRFCKGEVKNSRCPFFFCKIKRFFNNLFKGKRQRRFDKANAALKAQQDAEQEKIKQLSVRPDILRGALDLSDARSKDAIAYYVFKDASFSYHNIDKLLTGGKFVPFHIDEPFDTNKDVRIILRDSRSVLPAVRDKNGYKIKFLFADMKFTIIGLQMYHGKIYLARRETNSDEKECRIEFKEVTEEELREEMRNMK